MNILDLIIELKEYEVTKKDGYYEIYDKVNMSLLMSHPNDDEPEYFLEKDATSLINPTRFHNLEEIYKTIRENAKQPEEEITF